MTRESKTRRTQEFGIIINPGMPRKDSSADSPGPATFNCVLVERIRLDAERLSLNGIPPSMLLGDFTMDLRDGDDLREFCVERWPKLLHMLSSLTRVAILALAFFAVGTEGITSMLWCRSRGLGEGKGEGTIGGGSGGKAPFNAAVVGAAGSTGMMHLELALRLCMQLWTRVGTELGRRLPRLCALTLGPDAGGAVGLLPMPEQRSMLALESRQGLDPINGD